MTMKRSTMSAFPEPTQPNGAPDPALQAAIRLGDAAGARALGKSCAWLTDYAQARVHLTESLRVYQGLGDQDGQARVHQSLNWVAERQARYRDALEHSEQALVLFQAVGNRSGQAQTLNAIGWCHALLGDPRQARAYCQQALALNTELGNVRHQALTPDHLGYADHKLGNPHSPRRHPPVRGRRPGGLDASPYDPR